MLPNEHEEALDDGNFYLLVNGCRKASDVCY